MKEKIKEISPYVLIVVVIVVIRIFIATPVKVDGDSMYNTLNDNDIVLLSKLSSIDRFDIIVLKENDNNATIIKRVIGMPGDKVKIRNNKIYINSSNIIDNLESMYYKTNNIKLKNKIYTEFECECLYMDYLTYYDDPECDLSEEEKIGAKIVLKALEEPVRQIATNAGLEGAVILNKIKSSEAGIGFNAAKEEYVDMKKAGIVDPTKVTRSALQNAASIASMILTTESVVTDKKEKECGCDHANAGMPQGMEGMY